MMQLILPPQRYAAPEVGDVLRVLHLALAPDHPRNASAVRPGRLH